MSQGLDTRLRHMLFAIALTAFTAAFNTTAVMNALIAMHVDLKLSSTQMQWIVNAYMLASAAFIIFAGQLGTVFGRRLLLLTGGFIFIISSLLVALSTDVLMLLIGRSLQGLAAAMLVPGSMAVIKTSYPESHRRTAFAVWVASVAVGFAVGPLLGGFLVDVSSWRAIFYLNVIVILISSFIFFKHSLKKKIEFKGIHLDYLGFIVFVLGIVPFTMAIMEGTYWGWLSFKTLGSFFGGIVLLLLFAFIETRVKNPLIHFRFFKAPRFIMGNIGMFLTGIAMIGILDFFNLYAQNKYLLMYTPFQSGLALLPLTAGILLTSLSVGKLLNVISARWLLSFCMLLMAIGFFMLQFVDAGTTYAYLWLPLLLIGLGIGVTFATFPRVGMDALPTELAGEGSGVINTTMYLSGVIVIAVGTIIYSVVGHNRIITFLNNTDIKGPRLHQLSRMLLGSGQRHLNEVATQVFQQSALDSFTRVMLFFTISAAIGIFFCVWLIPSHRKPPVIPLKHH